MTCSYLVISETIYFYGNIKRDNWNVDLQIVWLLPTRGSAAVQAKASNIFRNIIQGIIRIFQRPKTERFLERRAPICYSHKPRF